MNETNKDIKNKRRIMKSKIKFNISSDQDNITPSKLAPKPTKFKANPYNSIDGYMVDNSITNTKILVQKNTVKWDSSVTGYIPVTHTTIMPRPLTDEIKFKADSTGGMNLIPTVQAVENRIFAVVNPFKTGKFRLEDKYIGVLTERTRRNPEGIIRVPKSNKELIGKLLQHNKKVSYDNILKSNLEQSSSTPLAETELVISDPNSVNTFKFTKDLFPDDPLSAVSLNVDIPSVITQNLSSTGNPSFNTATINDTLSINQGGGLFLNNNVIQVKNGPELVIGNTNVTGQITFNSNNISGISTFIPLSGSTNNLIPTQAAVKNFIDSIGAQGPQGPYGLSNTGLSGYQGPQGASIIGTQGWRGIQGPDGISIIGPTGPQGLMGTATNIGFRGIQGMVGLSGPDGPQGPQGNKGTKGLAGPDGYVGFQGLDGAQGVQGLTGYIGLAGSQGPQGMMGIQGTAGFMGPMGPSGEGDRGPQGFQGIQGPIGLLGSQGPQGFDGITGSSGVQGWQGTGLDGYVGMQGQRGAQGVQGIAGPLGPQGPQGFQGFQGVQGGNIIGAQGFQGWQGVTGTSYFGVDVGSVNFNYAGASATDTFAMSVVYGSIGSGALNQTSKYATARIEFNYTPAITAPPTGYFITDLIPTIQGIPPDNSVEVFGYCGKTVGGTVNSYDKCYIKLFPATGGSKMSIEKYDSVAQTATWFTTPAVGESFVFDSIYIPYTRN